MFVDLKEVVPDPIKGNPDVVCELEFSRLDCERGFIEAQDREQAMLAMLTGDDTLRTWLYNGGWEWSAGV